MCHLLHSSTLEELVVLEFLKIFFLLILFMRQKIQV